MSLLVDEILPASLAGRLNDEQRQTVNDAPRDARLAALSNALGMNETDALAALSQASGFDIATNLEADQRSRGLLPARLVHDFQIIPIKRGQAAVGETPENSGDEAPRPTEPLHLATAWLPDATMDDWIRTFTPRPLAWHLAVPERVRQLITENFG